MRSQGNEERNVLETKSCQSVFFFWYELPCKFGLEKYLPFVFKIEKETQIRPKIDPKHQPMQVIIS